MTVEGIQLSIFEEFFTPKVTSIAYDLEKITTEPTITDAASSFFDIVSKFDAVEIENSSLISDEDKEFCEGIQRRFDEAVDMLLKAKEFYMQHEMSNIFLSTKNLIKELDEKISTKLSSFKSKIVNHFTSTYSVTINSSKFHEYDHTVTYKDIVDDILLQMDGMNFAEKAQEEIKAATRETIYSPNVKVQSKKVSIAKYQYFEEWSGKHRNDRTETLRKLLRGIELFDSGHMTVRESFANLSSSYYRDDWFDEFDFSFMNKFESMKFSKNGKVELKFKTHEIALEFAKDYLKYT